MIWRPRPARRLGQRRVQVSRNAPALEQLALAGLLPAMAVAVAVAMAVPNPLWPLRAVASCRSENAGLPSDASKGTSNSRRCRAHGTASTALSWRLAASIDFSQKGGPRVSRQNYPDVITPVLLAFAYAHYAIAR